MAEETNNTGNDNKTEATDKAAAPPITQNDDINQCCRDCIRYEKYGEKCFYWWKGKRYCSRRVTSMEELEQENLFLG